MDADRDKAEQSDLFSSLLNQSSDAIVIADPKTGRILVVRRP